MDIPFSKNPKSSFRINGDMGPIFVFETNLDMDPDPCVLDLEPDCYMF